MELTVCCFLAESGCRFIMNFVDFQFLIGFSERFLGMKSPFLPFSLKDQKGDFKITIRDFVPGQRLCLYRSPLAESARG